MIEEINFQRVGIYNRAINSTEILGFDFQHKIWDGVRRIVADGEIHKRLVEGEYMIIIKDESINRIEIFDYAGDHFQGGDGLKELCDNNSHWIVFSNGLTCSIFVEWKNIKQPTMEKLIGCSFNKNDFISRSNGKLYSFSPNSGFLVSP